MIDDATSIEASFFKALAPPPSVKWYEWARNGGVYLPPKVATPFPGPYDVTRTPALVRAADALCDPRVWCVVVKKGSQGGGTQMGFAWLASKMVIDPAQSAVILGSASLAAQRSKNTFRPLILASPQVLAEVAPHKDALSLAEYEFRNGRILFFGGNSPTGLSSNAFVYMHISEENKFEGDDKEGAPVGLAIQRTKNFRNRKVFRECTPSIAGAGISAAFDDGTQEYFHVPCPHCGHRARMGWHKEPDVHYVWFDASLPRGKAAASARYRCAVCDQPWKESDRLAALHAAAKLENFGYVKTRNEDDTGGIVSIHYPSMLSTLASLPEMVLDFLTNKDNPAGLRQWVQGCLGEDWVPEVVQASDELLTDCRTAYQLDGTNTDPTTAPELVEVSNLPHLTMVSVDVQKSGCWFVVRRWWRGGVSALLQLGFASTFADVEAVASAWHEKNLAAVADDKKANRPTVARRLVVYADCGDGTRVDHLEACLKYGWAATFGAAHTFPGFIRETARELDSGKRKADSPSSVQCLELNVSAAKMNLIDKFRGEKCKSPRWFIAANTPEIYGKQVTAERYNPEKDAWEMRPGAGKDNHLFDCEVMNYIGAWANGFCQAE